MFHVVAVEQKVPQCRHTFANAATLSPKLASNTASRPPTPTPTAGPLQGHWSIINHSPPLYSLSVAAFAKVWREFTKCRHTFKDDLSATSGMFHGQISHLSPDQVPSTIGLDKRIEWVIIAMPFHHLHWPVIADHIAVQ